jgi:hypothetical protein
LLLRSAAFDANEAGKQLSQQKGCPVYAKLLAAFSFPNQQKSKPVNIQYQKGPAVHQGDIAANHCVDISRRRGRQVCLNLDWAWVHPAL